MARIYAPNEAHNWDVDGVVFVYGAGAVPDAKTDVIAWFMRNGYTTSPGDTLTEMDKLPKETLLAIAAEMDLTVDEDITKQYLVLAINTAMATATEDDYTVTYAKGNGSATGTAPTETNKYIGDVFALKANAFSYTGNHFTGWSDGTTVYQPGDNYTMRAANLTLTAQWEAD